MSACTCARGSAFYVPRPALFYYYYLCAAREADEGVNIYSLLADGRKTFSPKHRQERCKTPAQLMLHLIFTTAIQERRWKMYYGRKGALREERHLDGSFMVPSKLDEFYFKAMRDILQKEWSFLRYFYV
jgi:hypothetical protein